MCVLLKMLMPRLLVVGWVGGGICIWAIMRPIRTEPIATESQLAAASRPFVRCEKT